MITDMINSVSLMDFANEIGLLVVFALGWFVFQFDRQAKPDPREKEMHANYSAGQYDLVVKQALTLRRASASALEVTVAALLESEPGRLPEVVKSLISRNRSLCLGSVWEAVFGSSLSLDQFKDIVRDLSKLGEPDAHDLCKALADRGATGAELGRFGVNVGALADRPNILLDAYMACPNLSVFAHVFEALARTGPELAGVLAGHSTAQELSRDEVLRLLRLVPSWPLARDLIKGTKVKGADVYRAVSRFNHIEEVHELSGEPRTILASLKKCQDPQAALDLLAKLSEPQNRAYNLALAACAKDLPRARELFRRMPVEKRDVVSYNTILKAEVGAGQMQTVSTLLAQMKHAGVQSNHITYNTLLHACVAQKASPWPFVAAMEKQGLAPDAFTLTSLLASIQPKDADYLRRCIQYAQAVRPDAALVERLMEAAGRVGDEELSRKAVEVAASCPGSQRSFCARIKWAAGIVQAEQAWTDLRASGLQVGEHEFAQMAQTVLTLGEPNRALELLEEAKAQLEQATGVYVVLAKGFAQRKELARGLALLEDMQEREQVPNMLFNSLLDACGRCGEMDQATLLWERMGDLGINPDLVSFSTLVKGYCVKGDLPNALTMFGQLRRRGLRPDPVLFHSILDCCASKQMTELAEQVVRDMLEEGHEPTSITLSILVKLYGRVDLARAFEVFEELPLRHHFTPNAQTFTCLMAAAISHGELDQALALKQRMEAARQVPDAKVYQTLIGGCMRGQALGEAVTLAVEAAKARAMLPTLLNDLRFMVDRHRPELASKLRAL